MTLHEAELSTRAPGEGGPDEPTVLVAVVVTDAIDEGFCVALSDGQWAVLGLVTFVAKASLRVRHRVVDIQT